MTWEFSYREKLMERNIVISWMMVLQSRGRLRVFMAEMSAKPLTKAK